MSGSTFHPRYQGCLQSMPSPVDELFQTEIATLNVEASYFNVAIPAICRQLFWEQRKTPKQLWHTIQVSRFKEVTGIRRLSVNTYVMGVQYLQRRYISIIPSSDNNRILHSPIYAFCIDNPIENTLISLAAKLDSPDEKDIYHAYQWIHKHWRTQV